MLVVSLLFSVFMFFFGASSIIDLGLVIVVIFSLVIGFDFYIFFSFRFSESLLSLCLEWTSTQLCFTSFFSLLSTLSVEVSLGLVLLVVSIELELELFSTTMSLLFLLSRSMSRSCLHLLLSTSVKSQSFGLDVTQGVNTEFAWFNVLVLHSAFSSIVSLLDGLTSSILVLFLLSIMVGALVLTSGHLEAHVLSLVLVRTWVNFLAKV